MNSLFVIGQKPGLMGLSAFESTPHGCRRLPVFNSGDIEVRVRLTRICSHSARVNWMINKSQMTNREFLLNGKLALRESPPSALIFLPFYLAQHLSADFLPSSNSISVRITVVPQL
jgi:hypothetical protein